MTSLLIALLLAAPPTIAWDAPSTPWCEAPAEPVPPLPDDLGVLLEAPILDAERDAVQVALDTCRHASNATDPWVVLAIIRMERALDVPPEHRGLLVATACVESGFTTRAGLHGDGGHALGMMQIHEPLAAWCIDGDVVRTPRQWYEAMTWGGVDWRDNWLFSVWCYLAHIERNLATATRKCGADAAWRVSESMVASPARNWRCTAQSAHWTLMETWQ